MQLARLDRLVGARANPRIHSGPLAAFLEFFDQRAKAAEQSAIRVACGNRRWRRRRMWHWLQRRRAGSLAAAEHLGKDQRAGRNDQRLCQIAARNGVLHRVIKHAHA